MGGYAGIGDPCMLHTHKHIYANFNYKWLTPLDGLVGILVGVELEKSSQTIYLPTELNYTNYIKFYSILVI